MLGGRIRGQGTYGCIFQPALKCRGNKIKNSNASMVGKITSKQDAKNELEIAKILGSIDLIYWQATWIELLPSLLIFETIVAYLAAIHSSFY